MSDQLRDRLEQLDFDTDRDRELVRAALHVTDTPAPPVPDEDLPGYRAPFTGPIGAPGDPTLNIRAALHVTDTPSIRARLTPLRGYPTDDGNGNRRWTQDRTGAYLGFEDVIDALHVTDTDRDPVHVHDYGAATIPCSRSECRT